MGLPLLFRRRANTTPPKDKRSRHARTNGDTPKYYYDNPREKNLQKYWTIYDQGGLVSQAIDSYAIYTTTAGYRIEGPDKDRADEIKKALDRLNITSAATDMVVDLLVLGQCVQEPLFGRGEKKHVPVYLASGLECPSHMMRLERDQHGHVSVIKQVDPGALTHKTIATWKPNEVIYAEHPSLIHRAYDDIVRDVKTAEAAAVSVERHGFARYHIRVGGEAGVGIVDDDVIETVSRRFSSLRPGREITTDDGITIQNIDEHALKGLKEVSDWSIERLSAALGVPEEMLGLGRGSTEATARVRMEAFYKRIPPLQSRIAHIYNTQLLDRYYNTVPGEYVLVWNDASPSDEREKAEYISLLMRANPVDPFSIVSPEWIRSYLGIQLDEGGD